MRKGRSISLIGVLFSWIRVAKIIINIQQRSIKDVEVDHKGVQQSIARFAFQKLGYPTDT